MDCQGNPCSPFLSSPHRHIALAMMPASWPASQSNSATRAQIAANMHRIAKVIFCDVRRTPQIVCLCNVLVPSKAPKSRNSQCGLYKHIASETCIARFGELSSFRATTLHLTRCSEAMPIPCLMPHKSWTNKTSSNLVARTPCLPKSWH